jgi:cytochrome oxidase Cu insertion factor (SCO1/SenC/PrrC family)
LPMNMGHGPSTNDPLVTSAFRASLTHQLMIVLVLAVALAIVWNSIRTVRFRRAVLAGAVEEPAPLAWEFAEPAARRLLRIAFGLLWTFDGLLQTQESMPLGLTGGVITPSAASSSSWVQHLVNSGVTIWNDHPVAAAASAVWIQIGIGIFLLVAPRGRWSRSAGLVSAGWGLVVWTFGEAFGGIFGHGSSWLFGSPGAAVFYVIAGGLIALPDQAWETARTGRTVIRVTGVYFIGMGILEAWPGRGFWPGQAGAGGALVAMERQMSDLAQPAMTASLVRGFGSFESAHGRLVNAFVVVALIGIGACFVSGRHRLVRAGVVAGSLLCMATWVLVQDFGFLGGEGTDPNSMLPMALLFISGYIAMVRLPVRAEETGPVDTTPVVTGPTGGTVAVLGKAGARGRLTGLHPSYLVRGLAALGAVGIVLVGAAPMVSAAANPTADALVNQATNGTPNAVDYPAPPFTLTNQSGATVSLSDFRGKVVVLSFLDPTCTSDCPLIAQELRIADQMLGSDIAHVDLVSIVNNPLYTSTAATAAFDRQEGMGQLPNWNFLTGSLDRLHQSWTSYGVQTAVTPAGSMVAHSDLVFLIDRTGRLRVVLTSDPGAQGNAALHSSFSATLAEQVRQLVRS